MRALLVVTLTAGFLARHVGAQDALQQFNALVSQAAAARDANNVKSAAQLYQEALRLNPKWEEGWWLLGSLQYDSDQYAGGVESFPRLLELRPSVSPAWGLLGLCEFEIGRYGPSLEHIRRSLKSGASEQAQMTGVLRFHEALLLARDGQFEAALAKYASLASHKVTDIQVILGMGLTALRRPKLPGEVSAQDRDLVMEAGQALASFLGGDASQAQLAYDRLIARFPDSPGVHYAYGYFLYGSDSGRAVGEFTREIAANPDNAGAHAMLAWAYWFQDDAPAATREAKAALALDNRSNAATVVLGRSLVNTGQLQAGVQALESAVQREPDNLEAHLALASAYSEAGRKADAQSERQRCLRIKAGTENVAGH